MPSWSRQCLSASPNRPRGAKSRSFSLHNDAERTPGVKQLHLAMGLQLDQPNQEHLHAAQRSPAPSQHQFQSSEFHDDSDQQTPEPPDHRQDAVATPPPRVHLPLRLPPLSSPAMQALNNLMQLQPQQHQRDTVLARANLNSCEKKLLEPLMTASRRHRNDILAALHEGCSQGDSNGPSPCRWKGSKDFMTFLDETVGH